MLSSLPGLIEMGHDVRGSIAIARAMVAGMAMAA